MFFFCFVMTKDAEDVEDSVDAKKDVPVFELSGKVKVGFDEKGIADEGEKRAGVGVGVEFVGMFFFAARVPALGEDAGGGEKEEG